MRIMRFSIPLVALLIVQVLFVLACVMLYAYDCASCPSSSVTGSAPACAGPSADVSAKDTLQKVQGHAQSILRGGSDSEQQTIFVITPTFNRLSQKLDLTRLSQALFVASTRHHIHWIVVEDAHQRSSLVAGVLARSGLHCTHLNKKEKHIAHHFKGGDPRNEGLRYMRSLSPPPHPTSVVYFADDDNAYDAALFDEISQVTTIGVFPVGYSGARRAEFPVIRAGRVVGFEAYLSDARKFPMDMAGFAMSVGYFLQPTPLLFQVNAPKTTGETRLLEAAGAEWHTLQPLAANCTKVLVWHVRSLIPFAEFEPADDAHIVEV